jgi:hypothetical protein
MVGGIANLIGLGLVRDVMLGVVFSLWTASWIWLLVLSVLRRASVKYTTPSTHSSSLGKCADEVVELVLIVEGVRRARCRLLGDLGGAREFERVEEGELAGYLRDGWGGFPAGVEVRV